MDMFALDTAVILDYWGRGPGEMVTRVKGHEGEKIDVSPPVNFPRLRKQGCCEGRSGRRGGGRPGLE